MRLLTLLGSASLLTLTACGTEPGTDASVTIAVDRTSYRGDATAHVTVTNTMVAPGDVAPCGLVLEVRRDAKWILADPGPWPAVPCAARRVASGAVSDLHYAFGNRYPTGEYRFSVGYSAPTAGRAYSATFSVDGSGGGAP